MERLHSTSITAKPGDHLLLRKLLVPVEIKSSILLSLDIDVAPHFRECDVLLQLCRNKALKGIAGLADPRQQNSQSRREAAVVSEVGSRCARAYAGSGQGGGTASESQSSCDPTAHRAASTQRYQRGGAAQCATRELISAGPFIECLDGERNGACAISFGRAETIGECIETSLPI